MKICKQCHRELDESCFRQTKSRSAGLRKSTPGTKTLCRSCESLNIQAHNIVKALAAGQPVDELKLSKLKQHYQRFLDAGYPLVTKAAATLVGVNTVAQNQLTYAESADSLAELYEHIAKVRTRSYSSVDEADAAHRALVGRLRAAGLYEEVNNLLDRWFEEE